MKKIIYISFYLALVVAVVAQQTPNKSKSTSKNAAAKPAAKGGKQKQTAAANTPPPIPEPTKYAELALEDEAHAFGSMQRGMQMAHMVNFRNSGTGPLLISDVKGVKAEFPKDSIPAGGTGTISFIVQTEPTDSGEFRKEVKIISNSLNHPIKTYYILGIISN